MDLFFDNPSGFVISTEDGLDISVQFYKMFYKDHSSGNYIPMRIYHAENRLRTSSPAFSHASTNTSKARSSHTQIEGTQFFYEDDTICALTGRRNFYVGYNIFYSYIVNTNEGIILDAERPTYIIHGHYYDDQVMNGDATVNFEAITRSSIISDDRSTVTFNLTVRADISIAYAGMESAYHLAYRHYFGQPITESY